VPPITPRDESSRGSRPRPTMKHVAALAGVGLKTVSRVVNGEPNVSEETAARVSWAIAELNYQADLNAGNLKRANGRTMSIGLALGSVANPFAGAIHRAIESTAWERGTTVFAASIEDDPRKEQAVITAFLRRRVDGLILTTASPDHAYLAPEVARGTPVVFIDREPVGVSADAVVSENASGAALATRHLLNRGHRRVAYIGDRSDIQTARERLRGFSEELARAGIPAGDVPVVPDQHTIEQAEAAVGALLSGPARPTAIFTSQNLVTIGAVRALRTLGLHRDVALIGFDDFPLADLLEPGVTVVAQNPERLGLVAAERIFSRIDGDEDPARTFTIPTQLIERGSGEIPPRES